MKNLKNILRQQISLFGMLGILVIWQVMGWLKLLPKFILPTPLEIGQAFIRDAGFLASHSWATLKVALLGLVLGVILACILAVLMDSLDLFCGAGNFSIPLALNGAEVLGVESSPAGIHWARRNAVANGLEARKASFIIGCSAFYSNACAGKRCFDLSGNFTHIRLARQLL